MPAIPAGSLKVQSQSGWTIRFFTKDLVNRIGKGVHKAFKEIAPEMEEEMKDFAPVDTGRLRSSIKVRAVQGRNPRIEVTTVGYGFFVENGTDKFPPQPFILPVIMKDKWIKQLERLARSIRAG